MRQGPFHLDGEFFALDTKGKYCTTSDERSETFLSFFFFFGRKTCQRHGFLWTAVKCNKETTEMSSFSGASACSFDAIDGKSADLGVPSSIANRIPFAPPRP